MAVLQVGQMSRGYGSLNSVAAVRIVGCLGKGRVGVWLKNGEEFEEFESCSAVKVVGGETSAKVRESRGGVGSWDDECRWEL